MVSVPILFYTVAENIHSKRNVANTKYSAVIKTDRCASEQL